MILGLLSGFWASFLGWQINLVSINRGIERGRTAAFFVGFGAVIADLVLIWIAFTGAVPLLRYPQLWNPAKWVGIVTILLVAGKFFFYPIQGPLQKKRKKRNPTKNFLIGFLIVASNPAVYFMWIGIISFILTHFPEAHYLFFELYFFGGFLLGGVLWYAILARIILPHVRMWQEHRFSLMSKFSAVALLVVAFMLIFEKF